MAAGDSKQNSYASPGMHSSTVLCPWGHQAIELCVHRELIISVAEGAYIISLTPVRLKDEARGGRLEGLTPGASRTLNKAVNLVSHGLEHLFTDGFTASISMRERELEGVTY